MYICIVLAINIKYKLMVKMSEKIVVMLFSMLVIITSSQASTAFFINEEDFDNKLINEPSYSGFLIGRIKDVNRFENIRYLTCQAVRLYYDVLFMHPPCRWYYSGWAYSGEIKIYRPYFGVIVCNFIFIFAHCDSDIFN